MMRGVGDTYEAVMSSGRVVGPDECGEALSDTRSGAISGSARRFELQMQSRWSLCARLSGKVMVRCKYVDDGEDNSRMMVLLMALP